MRIGAGVLFVICFATGLCAQIRGTGSVVNPAGGSGTPGVTRTLGSVVNPAQGGIHVPGSGKSSPVVSRTAGYLYPIYIGGYYTPYISQDNSAAYAPVQPDAPVAAPPQQPVTPVIINNYNYNYPVAAPLPPEPVREQAQPAEEDNSPTEPSHYLIAFQDHTIYAATAYWVDGDTLHYFTAGNVHNQASLALVDRDFTERLNKEAGVEVKLPAPPK